MNMANSFLGVSSGKFVSFVVMAEGVHLDPKKNKGNTIYTTSEKISKNYEVHKNDWYTSIVSSPILPRNVNPFVS